MLTVAIFAKEAEDMAIDRIGETAGIGGFTQVVLGYSAKVPSKDRVFCKYDGAPSHSTIN
jgi:hypothetical protein